jgi:hypothetical protein
MEPRVPAALPQHKQQATGQSVGTPNVNSLPLANTLRTVIVVQQFVTDFNGAVSEQEKTVATTKIVLNLTKKMPTGIHRRKLLKIGRNLLY